jgi:hypothetical protein
MTAKRALREFRVSDEAAAEDRAWTVVRSVRLDAVRPYRPRHRWRAAIVPALAALALAVVLTPAGATVRRWIGGELGARHAAPAVFSLPAPGRVLLSGPGGTWIVHADGSARRLGRWRQATWSPHGLYVAVAGPDELAAVDPRGSVQWTLARPGVSDPEWYGPTGYRVAYLSGRRLRVVAGDGSGDRVVASGVASVAPAWRDGYPYQLAYVTRAGIVVVRDADTGAVSWSARVAGARAVSWSPDGSRLLVVARTRALVFGGDGGVLFRSRAGSLAGGALSPDGRSLALIRGGDVVLSALFPAAPARSRLVLSGSGLRALAWSPDGRWLLVSWPAADQWVLVRVTGRPRIEADSRIAEQFSSRGAFPALDGWCCVR